MWNPDPRCKHNTPIAQTQCKACMNDEIIELRSKLDSALAELGAVIKLKDAYAAELDDASPMRTCARCGKHDRTHRMVWEEGDEMECVPCNERCNAQERAEGAPK